MVIERSAGKPIHPANPSQKKVAKVDKGKGKANVREVFTEYKEKPTYLVNKKVLPENATKKSSIHRRATVLKRASQVSHPEKPKKKKLSERWVESINVKSFMQVLYRALSYIPNTLYLLLIVPLIRKKTSDQVAKKAFFDVAAQQLFKNSKQLIINDLNLLKQIDAQQKQGDDYEKIETLRDKLGVFKHALNDERKRMKGNYSRNYREACFKYYENHNADLTKVMIKTPKGKVCTYSCMRKDDNDEAFSFKNGGREYNGNPDYQLGDDENQLTLGLERFLLKERSDLTPDDVRLLKRIVIEMSHRGGKERNGAVEDEFGAYALNIEIAAKIYDAYSKCVQADIDKVMSTNSNLYGEHPNADREHYEFTIDDNYKVRTEISLDETKQYLLVKKICDTKARLRNTSDDYHAPLATKRLRVEVINKIGLKEDSEKGIELMTVKELDSQTPDDSKIVLWSAQTNQP